MSQDSPNRPREAEPQPGYVPASPTRRIAAWVGVIYMVIILALTTYFYFTGSMLGNLAPLLTVPGLIGLGILSLVSWRSTGRPGKWIAILLAVVCWLLAIATIPIGIVGLLSNFGVVGFTVLTF